MIPPEEQQSMVKDTRRSSEEIIPILLKILTNQPQSVSRLSSGSKELDDYLSNETIGVEYIKKLGSKNNNSVCFS